MDSLRPPWLSKKGIIAGHDRLIADHGGLQGIRDENALESALERPRNRHAYEEDTDTFDLAAEYGFGIACNHPFSDGNKRTALLAMKWFIEDSGFRIYASDNNQLAMILDVAGGRMDKDKLAAWLRLNSK